MSSDWLFQVADDSLDALLCAGARASCRVVALVMRRQIARLSSNITLLYIRGVFRGFMADDRGATVAVRTPRNRARAYSLLRTRATQGAAKYIHSYTTLTSRQIHCKICVANGPDAGDGRMQAAARRSQRQQRLLLPAPTPPALAMHQPF